MVIAEIVALLRASRFTFSTEEKLQQSIASTLAAADIAHEREKVLAPGSRIDFLCASGVGIEAKLRAPKRRIFSQIERYAGFDEISGIILVSGTAMGLPHDFWNSKPLFLVSLGRSCL